MEARREIINSNIRCVRDLVIYTKAFDAAMEIFVLPKLFLKEELYSLTDQMRRSSRSVCANISEAWQKRRYFINKLSDSGQEADETQTWLEFSLACNYLDEQTYEKLFNEYEQIFAMLHAMTKKANTFCSSK